MVVVILAVLDLAVVVVVGRPQEGDPPRRLLKEP
jgi:hypothetical protein